MDFTLRTYSAFLKALISKNYTFQTFRQFIEIPNPKVVILRHDVDLLPQNSLVTARIEHELGICGSYYFRIVPESFDVGIIKAIAEMGHEIGYHYETMDTTTRKQQNVFFGRETLLNSIEEVERNAFEEFKENLDKFRQIAEIKTICMHGSPLSKYDNRNIWKNNNYRNLGIIGEPYFDINYDEVLYLTDTGRRWDGNSVSIRDKVVSTNSKIAGLKFRNTANIIDAINTGNLPQKIMITVHPQRWTDNLLLWAKELVMQRIKNVIKGIILRK